MLFNSAEFGPFLLLALLGYWGLSLAGWRAQKVWLVLASYAFYASWNPWFVLLLLASTTFDFFAGRAIAGSTTPWVRRGLMVASATVNLGALALFKYGTFFADAAQTVGTWFGVHTRTVAALTLPIGISFYTFESLSYTIDVYRR